jgi:hypothetical protein
MQINNHEMVSVEQVVDYQLVLVQMVFLVDHLDIMLVAVEQVHILTFLQAQVE